MAGESVPERRIGVQAHEHRRYACESRTLTQVDRAVLMALWLHADNHTGRCYPSQATIAGLTGYCERAVRSSIQRLDGAGWIGRATKGGTGQDARLTVYQLTVPFSALPPEFRPASGTQDAGSHPGTGTLGAACTTASGTQAAASTPGASGIAGGYIRQLSAGGIRHLATGHPAPRVPPNSSLNSSPRTLKETLPDRAIAHSEEEIRKAEKLGVKLPGARLGVSGGAR